MANKWMGDELTVIFLILAAVILLAVLIVARRLASRKSGATGAQAGHGEGAEATALSGAGKSGLRVIPGNAQHIGAREEQQDAWCFSPIDNPEAIERHGVLAVLADGMGGFAMGGEAGRLAVQTMLSAYTGKTSDEPVPQALERSLREAGRAVYELAKQHGLEWSVGTTLIAAAVKEGRLYWTSVGDSRIYLYRNGGLTQLTQDHVYANRLQERVRAGVMTQEEADTHPERQLLTSYLGIPKLVEIDANREPLLLQAGDWILLCSDGLYDVLSEPLLAEAVRLPPQRAAEYILRQVLVWRRPYQDNATIAILAYG
ncbi:PP2C family protein-serine/threonine phosphatase [Paenibacillus harenae]|uniref:PP2C family protein-serine/threonine phosphatase n=1 Tax=Paenibacillus harenae TaxID=306543 RepID=UPI00041BE5CE|nr:protein phosphatase 2C domain-containing protein [Paenibacillus harenae]